MASSSYKAVIVLLALFVATSLLLAAEAEASNALEPSELSKVVVVSDAVISPGIIKFLDYIERSADAVKEVVEICKKAAADACPCRPGGGGGFVCQACCRIKREVPAPKVPVNRLKILQFIQNCKRFRSTCQQPLGEICKRAAIGCPCRGNDVKCLVCCGVRG
uniref:Cysteine-rich rehydration-responsive 1 n=1 Tax=Lindernia subracemosa TaxID=303139 RepID=A0A097HTM1_9LAMI|nr:cysteine-rich rehydration-responsive 1 [Lindernia subracemosa]